MPLPRRSTGVVFVGAGPAGLAPLFAAACAGKLRDLLARGVTILERGVRLGSGALPRYAISSDSTAESFLDILTRSSEPNFRALRGHPLALQLAALGKSAAPLLLVAQFLELAGGVLCDLVAASEQGRVVRGADVQGVTRVGPERWRVRYRHLGSGEELEIECQAVVLALGAAQPSERLYSEFVAGAPLLPRFNDKLLQSGDLLAHGGFDLVSKRLQGRTRPRVVIVGGSTSAGATAARLLAPASPIQFAAGDLLLMHRKPLRIFYESVSDALADDYDEFRDEDVCTRTGRVYRFSGFRLESRELIMAVRGIGKRPAENRLQLFHLTSDREAEAQRCLAEADLIIAALGYRPGRLPIIDEYGQEFALADPRAPLWSTVDAACRLQTEQGTTIPNLYAVGLAVGPAPTRDLGGELDFHGQVNSLWMWQHVLGLRIAEGLIEAVSQPQAALKLPMRSLKQDRMSDIAQMTPISVQETPTSVVVGASL